MSYIRDHPYLSNSDTSIENFLTTDMFTYLSTMQHHGTYGDHITLAAAAALYSMQIVVISDNKEFGPRVISESGIWRPTERFIVLGHQQEGRGEHYFSLTAPSSQAISNLMASSSFVNVSRCNAVEKSTEISSTDSASTCSEHFTSCNVTDLGTLFDGPARPLLHKYPKSTFGKQNRAFSATHYESYDFIEYSISSDSVFCFPCRFLRHLPRTKILHLQTKESGTGKTSDRNLTNIRALTVTWIVWLAGMSTRTVRKRVHYNTDVKKS